jgi:hypothetical protein
MLLTFTKAKYADMKQLLQIISGIIILAGCNSREQAASLPVANIPVTDAVQQTDTLGRLISTIEIKLKATKEDLKVFDDGIVPWISLEKPGQEMNRLIDGDKIVLPYAKVSIIIDYPLNTAAVFEITTTGEGFSTKQIILEISKKYHEIYALEESSATTKTLPMEKRKGLINRNETNGKYGVCCHDLADLDLSTIDVHQNTKGKITLVLGVES